MPRALILAALGMFFISDAIAAGDWILDYKESKASGQVKCSIYSPAGKMLFMLFRSADGHDLQRVSFIGRKHPGSTLYVNIDGERFSANEDDIIYWGQEKVIQKLLEGHELWAEWTDWPNRHGETHAYLAGFSEKHEECSKKMGF